MKFDYHLEHDDGRFDSCTLHSWGVPRRVVNSKFNNIFVLNGR